MRIAIPVRGDEVFSPLGEAEAFHFYEDDHGRIMRQFLVPMEKAGLDSALELLEQYGIDALIAGEVSAEERIAVPNNHCNACGFKGACSLRDKGGCGK